MNRLCFSWILELNSSYYYIIVTIIYIVDILGLLTGILQFLLMDSGDVFVNGNIIRCRPMEGIGNSLIFVWAKLV